MLMTSHVGFEREDLPLSVKKGSKHETKMSTYIHHYGVLWQISKELRNEPTSVEISVLLSCIGSDSHSFTHHLLNIVERKHVYVRFVVNIQDRYLCVGQPLFYETPTLQVQIWNSVGNVIAVPFSLIIIKKVIWIVLWSNGHFQLMFPHPSGFGDFFDIIAIDT